MRLIARMRLYVDAAIRDVGDVNRGGSLYGVLGKGRRLGDRERWKMGACEGEWPW